MRDKPSFDDLEAKPAPQRRFRGLTDAEWAARVARRERTFHALCGVIFGFVVGVLGVWHWLFALRTQLPALLVIGGSMLAFAAVGHCAGVAHRRGSPRRARGRHRDGALSLA